MYANIFPMRTKAKHSTSKSRTPARATRRTTAARKSFALVRIDKNLKREADALFTNLGFDTQTAINVFLTQALSEQGLPFKVKRSTPNAETMEAMAEVEEMKRAPHLYKGYNDVDEMMREILADEI